MADLVPSDDLRTPDEWLALKHPGLKVMDPDGWRGANGRPWTDPITEDEFGRRLPYCTVIGIGGQSVVASTGKREPS